MVFSVLVLTIVHGMRFGTNVNVVMPPTNKHYSICLDVAALAMTISIDISSLVLTAICVENSNARRFCCLDLYNKVQKL
jgi:hypothetical protein